MAAISLATLAAQARERADMISNQFVTDTANSVYRWINEGARELHDLLTMAYGEEYVEKEYSFNTVVAQSDYALPSDFYKQLGIDLALNGKSLTLKPYMMRERNAFKYANVASYMAIPRYRIIGSNLRLLPAPNSILAGTLFYVPQLQVLVHGTGSTYANSFVNTDDTIDFPGGWEKFVIVYAAKEMLQKEESDTAEIVTDLERYRAHLQEIAHNRDLAAPQAAVDVDVADMDPRWLY